MKAQYNVIYFDTGLYESEFVVKGAETAGYNLILRNKDLFEEVPDLIAWLSKR